MFGIEKGVIIRTAVLLLALINTTLQLFGVEVLPFTSDDIEMAITAILNVAAALAAWWKNNSFTKNARQADEVLNELKTKGGR